MCLKLSNHIFLYIYIIFLSHLLSDSLLMCIVHTDTYYYPFLFVCWAGKTISYSQRHLPPSCRSSTSCKIYVGDWCNCFFLITLLILVYVLIYTSNPVHVVRITYDKENFFDIWKDDIEKYGDEFRMFFRQVLIVSMQNLGSLTWKSPFEMPESPNLSSPLATFYCPQLSLPPPPLFFPPSHGKNIQYHGSTISDWWWVSLPLTFAKHERIKSAGSLTISEKCKSNSH